MTSLYAGLDISDRLTHFCVVDEEGAALWRGACATDPEALALWRSGEEFSWA